MMVMVMRERRKVRMLMELTKKILKDTSRDLCEVVLL